MKIQDILNQAKPCWKYAAMDQNKKWRCYTDKPKLEWSDLAEYEDFDPYEWVMVDGYKMPCLSDFFDIEPFDGDWKDSLICRDMRKIFIHESSKTLDGNDTEECNLSYKEQIEKAKKDCVERSVCNTMSLIYLQAFKLYADIFDVLDLWKFVILKDDGTSVDVTDNTEDAFAMMAKQLNDLFNVEIERN